MREMQNMYDVGVMPSKLQIIESPANEQLETTELACIETLRKTQLFEGLTEGQLEAITLHCRQVHCCKGTVLFSAGDEATGVFVVLEGEVYLEVELFMGYHLRPKTIIMNRVEKGDAFGWSALLEPCRIRMTARCTRNTDVIVIAVDDLKALLKTHPDIGLIVMENMAKIVYDRLLHARQRMIAEFGLEGMYQAHRAY